MRSVVTAAERSGSGSHSLWLNIVTATGRCASADRSLWTLIELGVFCKDVSSLTRLTAKRRTVIHRCDSFVDSHELS